MNALELRKLFEKGSQAPLDKLSLAEINKAAKTIQSTIDKLETITQKESIHNVLLSVPQEDRALFDLLRKAEEKKSKNKLDASRSAQEKCSAISSQLRPTLQIIRQSTAEVALAKLGALSKEQLLHLSLLANVSDQNGQPIKYTPANRVAWLGGLGIKVSGVAVAKRKKRS